MCRSSREVLPLSSVHILLEIERGQFRALQLQLLTGSPENVPGSLESSGTFLLPVCPPQPGLGVRPSAPSAGGGCWGCSEGCPGARRARHPQRVPALSCCGAGAAGRPQHREPAGCAWGTSWVRGVPSVLGAPLNGRVGRTLGYIRGRSTSESSGLLTGVVWAFSTK